MGRVSFATCNLCEACCGLRVAHDGRKILNIRGDRDDPMSRGYLCPKGVALQDVQHDPDRLRTPLRRSAGENWEAIDWATAFDEVAERLDDIQRRHGRDALAIYFGNPTAHSYTAMLYGLPFFQMLGTRNRYSANSTDSLPRLLVSLLLYGNQAILPVPDIERTEYFLIIGANPAVSNGSVMTAPDCRRRLREIRERGGRVVVMDPRRTETAELADEHHFIRPGTDPFFLLAVLNTLFSEDRIATEMPVRARGVAAVRTLAARFPAERVANVTGVPVEMIRAVARGFSRAGTAVCYGRFGACTQRFGTLTSWLIDVLNIVTGNLDRVGGAMIPTPPVDLPRLAARAGQCGHFGRWKSRVGAYPEFSGELPVAALAEEIETPGRGQIRALFTHAGNPVLSVPNGRRLEVAFGGLEFMVSMDIYLNETTRFADIVLPPTFGLERSSYPLAFGAVSVRNMAKFVAPVLETEEDTRHDWQIFQEIAFRMLERRGGLSAFAATAAGLLGRQLGPERVLDTLIRTGPYGRLTARRGRGKSLSVRSIAQHRHGMDLGPLEAGRLQKLMGKRTINLMPAEIARDVARLEDAFLRHSAPKAAPETALAPGQLRLIGRRQLRSNNSWMHNSQRLVSGRPRCTLMIHPDDARPRGFGDGDSVRIESRVGAIEALVEVTDALMPGVISLPHGWGHDRPGVRLRIASEQAGPSVNDICDENQVDGLSGCTDFSGVPVTVVAVRDAVSLSDKDLAPARAASPG